MTNRQKSNRPAIYEIRVAGTLDPSWSDWFEGFTVTGILLEHARFSDESGR